MSSLTLSYHLSCKASYGQDYSCPIPPFRHRERISCLVIKTMRGLKKNRTTILRGYQLYHNFIRPHMALDEKTPAEACGLKVDGENKWLTLIQNASKKDGLSLKPVKEDLANIDKRANG